MEKEKFEIELETENFVVFASAYFEAEEICNTMEMMKGRGYKLIAMDSNYKRLFFEKTVNK